MKLEISESRRQNYSNERSKHDKYCENHIKHQHKNSIKKVIKSM